METIFNGIAGVLGVYFIVAMLLFFRYFYFKKGSLKKSLLHVLISVLLLVLLTGAYMFYGKTVNEAAAASEPGVLTTQMKKTLDTKTPDQCDFRELAQIVVTASYPIAPENTAYLGKIKEYYIYYQMQVPNNTKDKETIAQEFDELREQIDASK